VSQIVEKFKSFIKYWEKVGFIPKGAKYIPTNEICPRPAGFQAYEINQVLDMGLDYKKLGGGFCQMWAIFYLEMVLKFPTKSGTELNDIALKEFEKMGNVGFIRHIINYTTDLSDKINSYFGKEINAMSKPFMQKLSKDKAFSKEILETLIKKINEYILKNSVTPVESDNKKYDEIRDQINQQEAKIQTIKKTKLEKTEKKAKIKEAEEELETLRDLRDVYTRESGRKRTGSGRKSPKVVTMKKSDFIKEHKKLIKLFEMVTKEGAEQKAELKKMTGGGPMGSSIRRINKGMKGKVLPLAVDVATTIAENRTNPLALISGLADVAQSHAEANVRGGQKKKITFVSVTPSKRKGKKWTAVLNVDGKNRIVHFGAAGMEDYTMHKTKSRMEDYVRRHKARENWTKSGILSPGFWSRWLLWNKPDFNASLSDLRKRFKI